MPLQPHGLEEPQTACGRLRFWQTATPITAPDLKLFGTQTCRWLQPSSPSAHRYTLSRLNAPTSNAPAQTLLHAWFFGEPCCYTLAPFSAALVLRLQTRHLNYRGIVIASISPNPTFAANSDNITNNSRCALEVPAKSPLVQLDDDDVKSIVYITRG